MLLGRKVKRHLLKTTEGLGSQPGVMVGASPESFDHPSVTNNSEREGVCCQCWRPDSQEDGKEVAQRIPRAIRKLGNKGQPGQEPRSELLGECGPVEINWLRTAIIHTTLVREPSYPV